MIYFVDTNIFMRFFIGDSPKKQSECLDFIDKIDKAQVVAFTSQLVLAEVAWTLKTFYKLPKLQIVDAIKSILRLEMKLVDGYKPITTIMLYEKNRAKYIDCAIASIPQIYEKKWTVVSYDRDFDKLGILRIEPGNIVHG